MGDGADDFLVRFHARNPGVTARALDRGRLIGDGRSSYEALAALARPGERLLDLGCGDGHLLALLAAAGHRADRLVGVDLSAAELAAAAARPSLAGARLAVARADALPLPDASIDVALSHLGFTLMSRIDGVADELARALAPGGRFAAIVGGGPKGDDGFARFLDRLGPVLAREGSAVPRLGDLRARSDAGLADLLSPARGFADPSIEDLALSLDGRADEVWDTLATSYELDGLAPAAVAEVHAGWLADVGDAPVIRCTMALRLVVCWRSD